MYIVLVVDVITDAPPLPLSRGVHSATDPPVHFSTSVGAGPLTAEPKIKFQVFIVRRTGPRPGCIQFLAAPPL